MIASISGVLDSEWLHLSPVRVGRVPPSQGTPDRYVTVAEDDKALLRVDLYAFGPDCFAFEDAIVWRGNLVIGFGSHVHAIAMSDHSAITVDLGGGFEYFGHLYPTPDYLLIASGQRLFRMEPDRSILWRTDILAVDGVVVVDCGPPIIRGDAEHDPPGGWLPFAVSAADGSEIPIPDEASTRP